MYIQFAQAYTVNTGDEELHLARLNESNSIYLTLSCGEGR